MYRVPIVQSRASTQTWHWANHLFSNIYKRKVSTDRLFTLYKIIFRISIIRSRWGAMTTLRQLKQWIPRHQQFIISPTENTNQSGHYYNDSTTLLPKMIVQCYWTYKITKPRFWHQSETWKAMLTYWNKLWSITTRLPQSAIIVNAENRSLDSFKNARSLLPSQFTISDNNGIKWSKNN